jgi:hypothetical protein
MKFIATSSPYYHMNETWHEQRRASPAMQGEHGGFENKTKHSKETQHQRS